MKTRQSEEEEEEEALWGLEDETNNKEEKENKGDHFPSASTEHHDKALTFP